MFRGFAPLFVSLMYMQKADLCLIVLTFFIHIIFSYVIAIQTLKVVSEHESD